MKEYIGFVSIENEICIDERQPIVRCKDCTLQDDIKYCDRLGFYVGDDGYCAWPKKREPRTVEDGGGMMTDNRMTELLCKLIKEGGDD